MADRNLLTWWELQVPDLAQAEAFYGGVFGWTFQPWQEDYRTVHDGDGRMIGGLHRSDAGLAGRHIHVSFTIDVHDDQRDPTLEQHLASVEQHGGTVIATRTEIAPGMGWFATVADPSGLSFDLWSGRPADPAG